MQVSTRIQMDVVKQTRQEANKVDKDSQNQKVLGVGARGV